MVRAASSISCNCRAAGGKLGLTKTRMSGTPGTSSRSKPSRFGSMSAVSRVTPVMLAPGRLKLSTRPLLTGSPPNPNTMGMVDVARLAANADGSPPAVVSTATEPRALALDRKKLAAFSALGGGFLLFPIGDRRCNRTRASVGNAGGNARPSLTNATRQPQLIERILLGRLDRQTRSYNRWRPPAFFTRAAQGTKLIAGNTWRGHVGGVDEWF